MNVLRHSSAALLLALAGLSTSAGAASGTGPYYAPPAWSQRLACTSAANCPRFVVLTDWNDEAVLDRETGLVWQRTVSDQVESYGVMKSRCFHFAAGNRSGWRLPSLHELLSLRDPSAPQLPMLPAGHPFQGVSPTVPYWTTTTLLSDETYLHLVRFSDDFFFWLVVPQHVPGIGYRGWCVRGARDAGPY